MTVKIIPAKYEMIENFESATKTVSVKSTYLVALSLNLPKKYAKYTDISFCKTH